MHSPPEEDQRRDAPPIEPIELADFTATRRMVSIAVIAIVIGIVATYVASALLRLIALFTNLFYLHRFAFTPASPADHALGPASVAVPVAGALLIGAMARYGSERIRGHGIPEALEAILTRGSRVEPRVALLKPVSSAISIGSGGPFGAEGPIIMTGGAFGSLVAQLFKLTSAERKTLLVAGAAAGMSATFASPVAAILLAVEVARRGFHVSREYAIDELEILFVRDVMNTDIVVLSTDDTPLAALERIELDRHERSQHLYPILDDDAELVAAATFAELMAWASDPVALDRPLRALASPSPPPSSPAPRCARRWPSWPSAA